MVNFTVSHVSWLWTPTLKTTPTLPVFIKVAHGWCWNEMRIHGLDYHFKKSYNDFDLKKLQFDNWFLFHIMFSNGRCQVIRLPLSTQSSTGRPMPLLWRPVDNSKILICEGSGSRRDKYNLNGLVPIKLKLIHTTWDDTVGSNPDKNKTTKRCMKPLSKNGIFTTKRITASSSLPDPWVQLISLDPIVYCPLLSRVWVVLHDILSESPIDLVTYIQVFECTCFKRDLNTHNERIPNQKGSWWPPYWRIYQSRHVVLDHAKLGSPCTSLDEWEI